MKNGGLQRIRSKERPATGSKQLRRAFFKHLQPEDVNADQRGLPGMMNEMKSKMGKMPKRRRKEKEPS